MRNWDEELRKILDDPFFDDVSAPQRKVSSSDRLVAGFQQILEFVEANNRHPQKCDDRTERTLYNQLQGILQDSSKVTRCRPYDTIGLLTDLEVPVLDEPETLYQSKPITEAEVLDDIFNDPIFNEDTLASEDIFQLPDYMKRRLTERKEADYVAQREKCKDFNHYEAGFKEIHAGLKSGKYRLIKFKEAHVAQGRYFVEDGILVYIAGLDQVEKNRHGRKNSRTRCIYENGMESGIYMQTLCKNLYSTGYSVQDTSSLETDYLEKEFSIEKQDIESGTIYVLRSLSQDREIASIANLYKIGFTTTSVEARIANAKNEPTYLCAEVEIVATWKVYNVKSSTFESLIHRLFSNVQLQVNIDGYRPKEWYIVPFSIIEQAIKYIISGNPIAYDHTIQQIIVLNE